MKNTANKTKFLVTEWKRGFESHLWHHVAC